jgi:hypothetical protein
MEPETITLREVRFAIKACSDHSELSKKAEVAENVKKAAMMGVFERLLGIKTEQELKDLDADKLAKIARRRLRAGDVVLDGIDEETLFRVIKHSQARRNVAWKDVFVRECGEARAADILENAAEMHSYKFVQP